MWENCDTAGVKGQSRDIGYMYAVCSCCVLKRVTLKSVNSTVTVVGHWLSKARSFVFRRSKVVHAFYYLRQTLFASVAASDVTRRFHFRSGVVDQPRKYNASIPFKRTCASEHAYICTHTYPCSAIKQSRTFLSPKHFLGRGWKKESDAIYKTITPIRAVWARHRAGETVEENRKGYFPGGAPNLRRDGDGK